MAWPVKGALPLPSMGRPRGWTFGAAVLLAACASACAHATAQSTQDALDACAAWFAANGGQAASVELKHVNDAIGAGVFTRKPFKKGEVVIEVPGSLFVLRGATQRTPAAAHADTLESDDAFLILFLLAERHNASAHWAPYTRVLPGESRTASFASQYTEDFVDPASVLHKWIGVRQKEMATYFGHIRAQLGENSPLAGAVTNSALRWAFAVTRSRALTLKIDGKSRSVIVPFVDFLNTGAPDRLNTDCAMAGNGFVCRATRNIPSGAEVLVSYGPPTWKPNSRLLLDYGFVLPRTAHDVAVTGPPRDVDGDGDGLAELREGLLQRIGLLHQDEFRVGFGSGVDLDLIRFCRVRCASRESLTTRAAQTERRILKDEALENSEEACAQRCLWAHLETSLAAYKVPFVDDAVALARIRKSGKAPVDARLALVLEVLLGEKVALHDAMFGIGDAQERISARLKKDEL